MRNEQILRLEEMDSRHWWTKSRVNLINAVVVRFSKPQAKIFEVGAGSGGTLIELKKNGFVVQALEPTSYGAENIRKHDIEVIEASLDYLKDKKIDADLILLLDVLEHLENDKDSLEIIKNATRKGALLCITVPADPTLWSKLDEDVFHFRRYTKESILSLLDSGGWEIIEIRYWMSLLKPVARFRRKFLKGNFMSETKLPNRFINLLLKILLSLEAKSVFGKFPGTTILVVARN